jgi:hypothetical protein
MASSAKVDRINRSEPGRIQCEFHSLGDAASTHGGYMLGPWSVAGLASDSRNNMGQVKLIIGG